MRKSKLTKILSLLLASFMMLNNISYVSADTSEKLHETIEKYNSYISDSVSEYEIKFTQIQVQNYAAEAVTAEDEPADYELGDVDYSGVIDANDALMVLKAAARLITVNNQLADVDRNGDVDAADALLILKFAARLIPDFSDESINAAPVPVDANIDKIKSYINQYGDTDEEGYKNISGYYEAEGLYAAVAVAVENSKLVFYYISSTDEGVFTAEEMHYNGGIVELCFYCALDTLAPEYEYEAATKINPEKIEFESKFSFEVIKNTLPQEEGLDESLAELSSVSTNLALLLWDVLLFDETGYGLADIGFKNYVY